MPLEIFNSLAQSPVAPFRKYQRACQFIACIYCWIGGGCTEFTIAVEKKITRFRRVQEERIRQGSRLVSA